MQRLYRLPDKQLPRFPVAFLTNGGGVTEATKAEQLTNLLGVHVLPQQVILSHTPFRSLVPSFRDLPVLIIGRHQSLHVAREYGFRNVVTSHDLACASSVPFSPRYKDVHKEQGPTPLSVPPIRAIFVFADPEDWYTELQIATDVLLGGGVIGRRPEQVPPDHPPVQVYFSNPDLVWANAHPVPRFGQGAFATCLEALYEKMTGRPLKAKMSFGKPNPEPYRMIERVLEEQARALGLGGSGEGEGKGEALPLTLPHPGVDSKGKAALPPFSAIYAIGDNSAADVRGANRAGHPWVSVLVRTGVFSGPPHSNCPTDPAHIVVDHVDDAVQAGLNLYRSKKWHSMR